MSPDAIDALHDLTRAIGSTLLHSLWQGALIAFLLGLLLSAVRKAGAGTRHGIACIAYFALPAWMVITFSGQWSPNGSEGSEGSGSAREALANAPLGSIPVPSTPLTADPASSPTWQLLATGAWILGTGFFGTRFATGWWKLRRLRTCAIPVNDPEARRQLAQACDRLGIRQRVALRVSDRISSPIMVGFLWPSVVLPAGILCGFPAAHLQSILSHELAHFRRWDYVVNLLQSAVDILLFYHPAASWMSRRIREEREFACDDLAASLPGNGVREYAAALAWLEHFRTGPEALEPAPALAIVRDERATLCRIRRLVGFFRGDSIPPGRPGEARGLLWIALALSAAWIASAATDASVAIRAEPAEKSVFSHIQSGRHQVEHSIRLAKGTFTWPQKLYRGYETPLFRSVVLLERGGKIYNMHREDPPLFEGLSNRWLLDHKLNILDGNLPDRDPDRDGFSVLEEFQAGTGPADADDHPDYAGKLRFIARHAQVYRITFAARPADNRFQLNRHGSAIWTRDTMIHRIGEVTEDGQLRLEDSGDGVLAVTFLRTGETVRLEKRKPAAIPTWFAELKLNLPGEEAFYVELGQPFRLKRDPQKTWTLIAVDDRGARIHSPETGESVLIGPPVAP